MAITSAGSICGRVLQRCSPWQLPILFRHRFLSTWRIKGPLWDAIVRKYDLQAILYSQIASWAFGDFIFNSEFDNSSTINARRAGFHDCIDTEDMFRTFFEHVRECKIIP